MPFNTQNFIFLFLPAFFLSYYLASKKNRNIVILIYSILFYAIGNYHSPQNILIIVTIIIINYLFLRLIYKYKQANSKYPRLLFLFSLAFNIGTLFIFKSHIINVAMPLGLSFYIFHFISLTIDTFNSKIEDKNVAVFNYLNYILYFPKMLSGPITRYDYFISKINDKDSQRDCFFMGLFYFAIGLSLKCLLADNINYIINQINVYGFESISILTAWLGMYSYTMKLYFDFAGYSLMAIGIAKSMGMDLPNNFDLPFCSKSISEFWRRWHITLGHFFRDYIYIPLGGNCKNENLLRQSFNLMVVWIVTGLWHGFKFNYIIWSIAICIFIILEKVYLNKVYNKCHILGRIVVNLFMPFAFLIFSIENLPDLGVYISRLFNISSIDNMRDFQIIFGLYWKVFVIGIVFMTSYPRKVMAMIQKSKVLMIIITAILIIVSAYMINITSSDTFKYFAF